MIQVKHLSYTYPDAAEPALHGIDLQIGATDFALVTGTSGSGKSTLLRCLNGLVPHFTGGRLGGEVVVDGHAKGIIVRDLVSGTSSRHAADAAGTADKGQPQYLSQGGDASTGNPEPDPR